MIKAFHSIILVLLFIGCKSNNTNEWFECYKEKSLYTIKKVIPIDLDTIKTLKDFNDYADKIVDTISKCCIQFGFMYNLEDLSLTTNPDTCKNIVIPGFTVWSYSCTSNIPKPELTIYLTNSDTIQIIQLRKDTTEFLYTQKEMITQYFLNYFDQKRIAANNFSEFNNRWMHFCLADTFDFKTKFLPVFNALFTVYNKSLKKFTLEKYKKTICQLDTSIFNDMQSSKNRFRIAIDNFDVRIAPKFTK